MAPHGLGWGLPIGSRLGQQGGLGLRPSVGDGVCSSDVVGLGLSARASP